MTYPTQTTAGQRPNTARDCLAALVLTQDDLVRPELRDDVILAKRLRRLGSSVTGRQDPLDGGHRPWRTVPAGTSFNPYA
ncbi:hypothetical protein IOC61_05040 [Halomonas sp. KAO]|uniref:hypothetical protein n=1 Tax=Halomonas sp. KAO TaxID=2783858 RepID=UPI00189DCDBB|nr:hypothetical protein [Halomonas sp. KAO]MBF7052681.1 hypothetical protein [Halomonas sp. KAO]